MSDTSPHDQLRNNPLYDWSCGVLTSVAVGGLQTTIFWTEWPDRKPFPGNRPWNGHASIATEELGTEILMLKPGAPMRLSSDSIWVWVPVAEHQQGCWVEYRRRGNFALHKGDRT